MEAQAASCKQKIAKAVSTLARSWRDLRAVNWPQNTLPFLVGDPWFTTRRGEWHCFRTEQGDGPHNMVPSQPLEICRTLASNTQLKTRIQAHATSRCFENSNTFKHRWHCNQGYNITIWAYLGGKTMSFSLSNKGFLWPGFSLESCKEKAVPRFFTVFLLFP